MESVIACSLAPCSLAVTIWADKPGAQNDVTIPLHLTACCTRLGSIMTARSLGAVFAALAHQQVELALRSLTQRRNRHGAIHATRKAIRRLRSILALCHYSLEPEASAVDHELKRLATSLSRLRDAHVVVATASQLAEVDDREIWLDVASRLETRRDALLTDALSRDPDFAKRRAQLSAMVAAVASLPWQSLSNEYLSDGMKRSTCRVAKAEHAAQLEPNLVNHHRWRRRLRRLRIQKQMIHAARRAAPSLVGSLRDDSHTSVRALSKQSDSLGRVQDLHMLKASLIVLDKSLPLTRLRSRVSAEVNLLAL
jgi:CHAD domain-containing protein